MSTTLRSLFSLSILAILVGGPWAYWSYRETSHRNLHVVEDGVLYRSGQLTLQGLARVVHDYEIRTVVCLREGEQDSDAAEEKYCRRWGINHVRIPPRAWSGPYGHVPAEQGLAAFRKVMDNRTNYPVLIHCFAGMHRTGAYCAVYRMDYNGWSNAEALSELKQIGYQTLESDRDLCAFLKNYRPEPEKAARTVSRRRQ